MQMQMRTQLRANVGGRAPARVSQGSRPAVKAAAAASGSAFMPPQLSEITEPAARRMAERYQRAPIPVPSLPTPALHTAFVPPTGAAAAAREAPPVVLLHGFDSSSLEMRRLHPLLDEEVEAWAVDLVGWGFTDHTLFAEQKEVVLTPREKRDHLFAFWREKVQRPMVLVGASLGGAIALEFALEHPEAVERIVLIDAQGFIDGIGPMAQLPRPLAAAGVWVLRTEQLRMAANRMAYHDQNFATEDAMRVGRLHTHLEGWSDANIAWMRGGGYSISSRLSGVQQPVLVLWGRNDQILESKYAEQFEAVLPDVRLQWLEECGHCGHLEKPRETADAILEFVRGGGARAGASKAAANSQAAA